MRGNQVDQAREITLIKRRLDEIERGRGEVALGLSLIAETALSGSVTSVAFSAISQSYRHLRLVGQVRTDRSAEVDATLMRFNGDTGANYDRQLQTTNNATLSGGVLRAGSSIQVGTGEGANSRASNFSPFQVEILGYSRTDAEKWLFSKSAVFGDVSADADLFIQFFGGRWRSTSAITSITLLPGVGPNFVSGCHFQLYGVY